MAEAFITRRGAGGIKPFISNITFGGTRLGQIDTEYGVQCAYFANGDVFVTVKLNDSTTYEGIYFIELSIPEGIEIIYKTVEVALNTASSRGKLFGFILHGAYSDVSMDISFESDSYYYLTANITIT